MTVNAKQSIASIVGFLVCVEIASGALQGYYTPLFTDIARHLDIHDADVNWFEAAQLAVSAICVPLLSRLGDLHGHRRVLLGATAVTAVASWGVALAPNFATFLVAWALAGFYVVWLPLEIAIIHGRTAGDPKRTRAAAAALVIALELSVIVFAVLAGILVDGNSMTVVLAVPAAMVTIAFPAIWFGVPSVAPTGAGGRVDLVGFGQLAASIGLLMAALILIRLDQWWWAIGAALLTVPAVAGFVRTERRHAQPLVDLSILGAPRQWPIQVTAALLGVSVLGAQIPLSTFARTDPAVTGYGLGVSAERVSLIVGLYVITLALGAGLLAPISRLVAQQVALAGGACLVGLGYLLFLPLHGSLANAMVNMGIAGVGSGLLVAALPAAAAQQAPASHTGFVTGMTNMTKTVGGAIASSVFAIALSAGGSIDTEAAAKHATLTGYLVVWAICGISALLAAALLIATHRRFHDV
ncbi:MFS transporter [Calidifontibacter terrae]